MKESSARHVKPKKKRRWWQRVLIWTGVGLGGILLLVVCCFLVVFYTPFFPQTRDKYILMTYHTSNPWLATAFFSDATISRVLEENKVIAPEGETDPNLIKPGGATSAPDPTLPTGTSPTGGEPPSRPPRRNPPPPNLPRGPPPGAFDTEVIYEEEGVDILRTQGDRYVARLIRVADPSRVRLGVTSKLMKYGERLVTICKNNNSPGGNQRRRL